MDDEQLSSLFDSTPSRCILLLEDIDCALPSREDGDEEDEMNTIGPQNWNSRRSQVTLSGLLNVLDGISSGEGRIIMATVSAFSTAVYLSLS